MQAAGRHVRPDAGRRRSLAESTRHAGEPVSETPTVPMIVSVDDHVVEPPHVWEKWLPEKLRDHGPHIERKGLAGMRHVGGGTYELEFDDDAPKADCWVFEGQVYPHKRH